MLLAAIVLLVLKVAQAIQLQNGIVNRQLKRVVFLNSPVLREEYSIVAELDEGHTGPLYNYLVIIPPSVAQKLALINAIVDDTDDSQLPVSELPTGAGQCPLFARCFVITLPKPLTRENPRVTFGLGITYAERYKVSPKVASQSDALGIRVDFSPYFFSPYPTRKQKTVIMLVKEFELQKIHCPEPRNLKPTTSPSAVGVIPGSAQFTCGLYENVPALHGEFGAMWVSFVVQRVPFFLIQRLDRTVEYSPQTGLLYVTEDYEFEHRGHHLKDEAFSRINYMQEIGRKGLYGQVVPLIPLSVPNTASEIEVRDEVGLIHSPKPRRKSPVYPDLSHVIEVQPRFPLQGGWSLSWRVSYTIPAKSSLSHVRLTSGKIVKRLLLPLFEVFHDVAVQDLKFTVVLPGDAQFSGSQIITTHVDNVITDRFIGTKPSALYLGRKIVASVSLKYACKEHHGYVAILFDIPWWSTYKENMILGGTIVLALMVAWRLFSVNLSLNGQYRQEKDGMFWSRLFRDRRTLLSDLARWKDNKIKTEPLFSGLCEASNQLELADVEKSGDGTLIKALSALAKLYQEQLSKIAAIINETNPSEALRLERDAVDIDSRILRNEALVLAYLAPK